MPPPRRLRRSGVGPDPGRALGLVEVNTGEPAPAILDPPPRPEIAVPAGPSRRAMLKAAATGAVAAFLRPGRSIAPAGCILDGGPWIADVVQRDLVEGARIADSWGRRGLRVVVGLGHHRHGCPGDSIQPWADALARHGWVQLSAPRRGPGAVVPWSLRHTATRRGAIILARYPGQDFLVGAEAVLLDTTTGWVIDSLERRAKYPWPGWMWVGTRYRRRRWTPSRFEFDALQARVEELQRS